MVGTTLTFVKKVASGTDSLNNPTYTDQEIEIEDCLIAPIVEPTNLREQQAIDQNREQVRIHLPKETTEDVSGSSVEWDGKVFTLDSDSVVYMEGNTPTRWNRHFRAEHING